MKIRNMALAVGITAVLSVYAAEAAEDLQIECQQAIADFKKADPTMTTLFTNSAGYTVFPHVGKGGFIVGGARGKGVVYEKGKVVGLSTMTQASIGAQAGGQSFGEIIFFETPGAFSDFKASKLELSAEANAAVAAEGASKSVKFKSGVAVFTLPAKGIMVQAAVGGQKFKFEPLSLEPTGRSDQK